MLSLTFFIHLTNEIGINPVFSFFCNRLCLNMQNIRKCILQIKKAKCFAVSFLHAVLALQPATSALLLICGALKTNNYRDQLVCKFIFGI